VVLGSIREQSFQRIWHNPENTLLMALKNKYNHLKGRCRVCRFLTVCGGGLRARADFAAGDPWAPDPACYLTDEEIGIVSSVDVSNGDVSNVDVSNVDIGKIAG
jgi:radical SAM protein with 4Fe4S-binding SPASM domain